jgi:pimeloyl-ACP methyl ester carboxylesterase
MLINNREINIETYGHLDDPPIVMLHHGLGSTHAWRRQVPAFTRAGYQLLVYDRWGYGKSDRRPYLSVPDFKDDLADLEKILEIFTCQSTILIGHSDGGTIALSYAAQNPQNLIALVTVAAHIYLEPKMEPGIKQIKNAFKKDPRFRKGLQRVHGQKFESTFYNWFNGWHNPKALSWDMRFLLKRIQCPTLVIQGEDDEHATPQHAIDIAENIPGAELWLVPGAGHMLPQEQVEEFNRAVISFLNAQRTS